MKRGPDHQPLSRACLSLGHSHRNTVLKTEDEACCFTCALCLKGTALLCNFPARMPSPGHTACRWHPQFSTTNLSLKRPGCHGLTKAFSMTLRNALYFLLVASAVVWVFSGWRGRGETPILLGPCCAFSAVICGPSPMSPEGRRRCSEKKALYISLVLHGNRVEMLLIHA